MKKRLLLILLLGSAIAYGSIQEELSAIPKQDQKKLERFFKWILCQQSMGYTLWGDKPATTTHWSPGFNPASLFQPPFPTAKLEDWAAVWQRHRQRFPIKKWIFSDCYYHHENELVHEFFLINVEECRRLYKQYPQVFSSTEPPQEILSNRVCANHLKLGLLFGFGWHNTQQFIKKSAVSGAVGHLPFIPQKPPKALAKISPFQRWLLKFQKAEIPPPASCDQNALLENYLTLEEDWVNFSSIRRENPLSLVPLPAFMVDQKSPETQELYQRYTQVQRQINQMMRHPHFLKTVLEKLCENP